MNDNKTLQQLAEEFVEYKKALGYTYGTASYYMSRYIQYISEIDTEICGIEKIYTDQYLKSLSEAPGTLYGTIAVLREFGRYLYSRRYTKTYIIPPKSCSQPVPEPPYFFTEKEINDFFEAVDSIEKHASFKGRELVIPAMFRLLYCCGLRCKEVRTLKCENVHLKDMFIDVMQSKGPKSRRIFISTELSEYLRDYETRIATLFPERCYFFPSNSGCYSSGAISSNFRRFWKKAYPDFELTTRPRAYDFRHHFAWANLNRWAADGMDVNVMLAYLMRYMGHQTITETLYYFHFVPDFFPTFREMTKELEDVLPEVAHEE